MGICISVAGDSDAKVRVTKTKGSLTAALLGIQGSGKSTFAKQMKILNCNGFEPSEVDNYKTIIRKNFLVCIQELSVQSERFGYAVSQENLKNLRYFKEISVCDTEWDDKLVAKMQTLFADDGIQKTRADLTWKPQIRADYLLEHFDRLTKDDFTPTPDDILVARQRTSGMTITKFVHNSFRWEMIDMGGQESERDKWDDVFNLNNLNAVIYIASLDEFNTHLSPSNKDITAMDTSMETFKNVMSEDRLKNLTRILFLNKTDLLKAKIASPEQFASFQKKFPEYTKSQSVEDVQEFIKTKYLSLVETPDKKDKIPGVVTHFTCALDTTSVKTVLSDVFCTVTMRRLDFMGML